MLTRQEVNRKLLHLIALLMPIGIFYIPKITNLPLWIPPFMLAVLFILSAFLEWARFKYPKIQILYNRCFKSTLRKNEEKKTTGATYIIGGAMICAVVFINAPHISFTVLTLFILGDGIAAITGLGIGRIKLSGKTLEGSLACFGLCILICTLIFPHVPFLYQDWRISLSWSFSLTASFLITLLEFFPFKISKNHILNDNIYVPVLSGIVLQTLLPFFRS